MPDILTLLKSLSKTKISPENGNDIIFFLDLNFRCTFFNRAFMNFVKVNNFSNIMNISAKNLFDEKNTALMKEKFDYVITLKTSVSFVMTFNENSKCKFAKITMFPIIQNTYIKGVLVLLSDITKEEQMKQSLLNRISQLNMLVENIPLITYLKDKNFNYIVGSKFSKNFVTKGIDPFLPDLQIDTDDACKIMKLEDSFVIHNKKSLIREKILKDTKGREHWYKVYKAPVFDENNNVNALVSVIKNIDTEKQIDNQKEMFVATIAHDLKNPLLAQITNLKLLYKGAFGEINDTQKQILSLIIESADFMNEMLYSVLSVYKYESGCIKLKKTKFKILDLIIICAGEFYNQAQKNHLKINYSCKNEDLEIFADKSQIRRVLTNLISNAVKYSLPNTIINISCSNSDNKLFINVENKSNPINENLKKRIFNKFISEKNTEKKGIGLGLYYCKKIIEAHNGNISLLSEGTENNFLIELPLYTCKNNEEITNLHLV